MFTRRGALGIMGISVLSATGIGCEERKKQDKDKMSQGKVERVVILGAMPQEIEVYAGMIDGSEKRSDGFVQGSKHGKRVFIGKTGIGTDNAAAATRQAIERYDPQVLVFTGVGGSLHHDLGMGDIAVIHAAVNYQTDLRAFDINGYVLGQRLFEPAETRIARADQSLIDLVDGYIADHSLADQFHVGYAATGDQFLVSDSLDFLDTLKHLTKQQFNTDTARYLQGMVNGKLMNPNVCDMETESVMRQANRANVPVIAFRQISDNYEGDAVGEFNDVRLNQGIEKYALVVDHLIEKV